MHFSYFFLGNYQNFDFQSLGDESVSVDEDKNGGAHIDKGDDEDVRAIWPFIWVQI